MQKVKIILLAGLICLLGATSVLAAKYNEAPMLRTRVAAGELPPVEERVPEEPYVCDTFEEIGRYGGTLHVYATDERVWQDIVGVIYDEPALARQIETGTDGKWFGPTLLKDYEFSDNYKILTLYLRKGARWSDGEPLTADDFTFYWLDCKPNFFKELPVPAAPLPNNLEKVEKVDDYTVRFYFPQPAVTAMIEFLHGSWGMWGPFIPKHYLKKWHIKYNPEANELAKEEGFENWWLALESHGQTHPIQNDMDLPIMGAWTLTERRVNLNVFERNPYYHAVDTAGNQLPYIDRVISEIVSPEVKELKVLSGAADIAEVGITLENYPLYKKNQEKGNYRILFKPGLLGANVAIFPNWFAPDLVLRKIYRDVRFRRALSLGIDREEINEIIYFGKAVPRQTILTQTTASWYKEEWDEHYTQHDPERANALLDEMGLKWDENHEWRLRPDGEPLVLVVEYAEDVAPTALLELAKKQCESIGIKLALKVEAMELFIKRTWDAEEHSVAACLVGYTEVPWSWADPAWAWSSPWAFSFARPWGQWLTTEGETGVEPPEDFKEQYARVEKLKTVLMDSEEAEKLFVEIVEFALEKLWYIGIVGMAPSFTIAKDTLGNVPDCMEEYIAESGRRYLLTTVPAASSSRFCEQFYFKE